MIETEESIIKKLNDSLIWAKYDFLQYKELFLSSRSPERKHIVQETAPDFFRQINGLLWDRMILSISKLTDKYSSYSNTNLSLDYIVHISAFNLMACRDQIRDLFESCRSCTSSIRKYRSKVVAHRDFDSSFSSDLSVRIDEVDEAFKIIEKIMNLYHQEKSNLTWMFDLGGTHDAGTLFFFLEQALIYDKMKRERGDFRLDMMEEESWRTSIRQQLTKEN